jgi:hypothetical protein
MRFLIEGLLARRPRDPCIRSGAEAICKLRLAGFFAASKFCHFSTFWTTVLNLILNAVETIGSIEEGVRELSITTKQHEAGGVKIPDQGLSRTSRSRF